MGSDAPRIDQLVSDYVFEPRIGHIDNILTKQTDKLPFDVTFYLLHFINCPLETRQDPEHDLHSDWLIHS